MANPGVVTMPDEDEIVRRFRTVHDNGHHAGEFYRPFARGVTGRNMTGADIARELVEWIKQFSTSLGQMTHQTLTLRLRRFITALIDDETIRTDANTKLDQLGIRQ